jgi:hypothetical protein
MGVNRIVLEQVRARQAANILSMPFVFEGLCHWLMFELFHHHDAASAAS